MAQKVITKVLNVGEKTKEMMVEYFEDFKREKTPPYAIFQADDGDTVVTMYQSGKVVFQGRDADLAADFWIETEKINYGKAEVKSSDDKKEKKEVERKIPLRINSIGSDEVGTGDYFGPIVVTAAYVTKDNIDFLLELGVKDSKKMSDSEIKKVVPEIIKKIPYHTFVLNNKQYNELYSSDMNMNKMKAILHNKVLSNFADKGKYPYDYIVVDQFENPRSYYNHLSDAKFKVYNITFLTKAEDQCLSVACASLISRYVFLIEMDKISKDVDLEIPKGAGDIVDSVGKEIIKKFGIEKLNQISKINFKNTEKIIK
ncbi:MAG: ribonuclease HIII [Bacilli bacterium]|nr:ribonuclease HIII [Bacilli bacterium]